MQNILTFLLLFLFVEGIAQVHGRLELKVIPSHSTVKLDGATIPTIYHSKMDTGWHQIQAWASTYQLVTKDFYVAPDSTVRMYFTMPRADDYPDYYNKVLMPYKRKRFYSAHLPCLAIGGALLGGSQWHLQKLRNERNTAFEKAEIALRNYKVAPSLEMIENAKADYAVQKEMYTRSVKKLNRHGWIYSSSYVVAGVGIYYLQKFWANRYPYYENKVRLSAIGIRPTSDLNTVYYMGITVDL